MFYTAEARALATLHYPELQFNDPQAVALYNRQAYPNSVDPADAAFINEVVGRTKAFDAATSAFMHQAKDGIVLNMGCGMCSRNYRLQHLIKAAGFRWVNIDLAPALATRQAVMDEPPGTETAVCHDIVAANWLNSYTQHKQKPLLIIMEGVSYYLQQQQANQLLINLAQKLQAHQHKAHLLFDFCHPAVDFKEAALNSTAVRHVQFQSGFNSLQAVQVLHPAITVYKNYHYLLSNTPARLAAENLFKARHNQESPYTIGQLSFGPPRHSVQQPMQLFGRPLYWNSRFAHYALNNGDLLFLAEDDALLWPQHLVAEVQAFLTTSQPANSFNNDLYHVHLVTKLQNAGLLVTKPNNNQYLAPAAISRATPAQWHQAHAIGLTALPCNGPLQQLIEAIAQEAPAVTCLVIDDYTDPRLEGIIDTQLQQGNTLLILKPTGQNIGIGPCIHPKQVQQQHPSHFCYSCFIQSVTQNMPHSQWAGQHTNRAVSAPLHYSPEAWQKYRSHIIQLVKQQAGTDRPLQISTLNNATGHIQHHPITRHPQCGVHGDSQPGATSPFTLLQLPASPKTPLHDGGYRTLPPAQVLKNIQSYLSPLTGIVHGLRALTSHTNGINTYAAAINKVPRSAFAHTTPVFTQHALGKGVSQQQSQTSAVAEAIERYSAQYTGNEPHTYAVASQLSAKANTRVYTPAQLRPYSQRQYQQGSMVSVGEQPLLPWQPDAPLHWHAVTSISTQTKTWVPVSACFSNTPFADEAYIRFNSNGCAAGSTLTEAVFQGFLELVERDAVAIWWYNKISRPAFDLTQLPVEALKQINAVLAAHWQYWVLDLTHDFNIPVAAAIARNKATGNLLFGFGAHTNGLLACQRALTELCQLLAVQENSNGNGAKSHGNYTASQYPFVLPSGNSLVPTNQYPEPAQTDLKADVAYCIDKARQLGFDVLVANLSRPPLPLHTVKVMVPGLCHIWPELGNPRLYQLPHQMGWRKKPLTEQTINQKPLFL